MASMRAEQRRVAAVWVDGPDSEAARASRERHIHRRTPTTGCEGQSVVVPSHYIWDDQWPESLRPRFQDFTDKATTTTEEPSAVGIRAGRCPSVESRKEGTKLRFYPNTEDDN